LEQSWSFACPDWWERLQAGQSLLPDLPLDRDAAQNAVDIYNKFCLPDVIGNPSLGEAGGDWFRDWARALFGSLDRAGQRRVKKIFGLVPKKNSKTTNSAALMLAALLLNQRPRADFINVAPTKLLAQTAYDKAVGMIECDPEGYLKKRFRPRDHLKEIDDLLNGSTWKLRAFDLSVTTGVIPAGILIDELHAIAQDPNAFRVLRQLYGGMLPIPESFAVVITTQSDEPPVGVFKADLARARAIRDGKIEGDMLPFLYEFAPEIQEDEERWLDTKIWHIVLPNLGRSVTIDGLLNGPDGLRNAQAAGRHEVISWGSQYLNIQVGSKSGSDAWPGTEFWDAQGDPELTLDKLIERCEVIVAGVDGGGLDDLLGIAFLGRETETQRWLLWCHAFAHEIVKERRKSIVPQLEDFARAGELTFVKVPREAFEGATDLIMKAEASGLLAPIAFDPAGANGVVDALKARGIEGDERIRGVNQGYQLAGPVKDVEAKLADGDLIHAAQALMAWCVGNAKIEQTKNAYIVTKAASGTAKIDPLMAVFNAAAMFRKDVQPASVYSATRGLISIG
jgi:phage terminase large subunit-like protein